jgi:galactonate dehydratase
VNIPVASGERIHIRQDFRELLESGAVDIAQPDVSQFGGILETLKLASWADAYDVLLAPHNVGGPVATAAALQVAAVVENFKIQEHFNDFADAWVKQAASGVPEVVDGYFAVPSAPGLGVELDTEFLAAHPREANAFNLFAEGWHLRR